MSELPIKHRYLQIQKYRRLIDQVSKELEDTGRILVCESGTEPVIRVMVEAETEEICRKYVDMVVKELQ